MNINIFYVLLVAVLIQGCATPVYDYQPVTTEFNLPLVNIENTVKVGESVLRKGSSAKHEVITLASTYTVGIIGQYEFSSGVYSKQGGDVTSGFYLPSKYGNRGVITPNAMADPFQVIQAFYSPQKLCGVSRLNAKMCNQATFSVGTQDIFDEENLVYKGKNGDVLEFSYNKTSNDESKPDILTTIRHDLSDGKEMRFGDATLEIMGATDESITYKLLSNL
jgi:hypothetical protein|tara:strand:- start:59 stop:721 length:663 start_codon:yes stop_codon:yes gene_type:complete